MNLASGLISEPGAVTLARKTKFRVQTIELLRGSC